MKNTGSNATFLPNCYGNLVLQTEFPYLFVSLFPKVQTRKTLQLEFPFWPPDLEPLLHLLWGLSKSLNRKSMTPFIPSLFKCQSGTCTCRVRELGTYSSNHTWSLPLEPTTCLNLKPSSQAIGYWSEVTSRPSRMASPGVWHQRTGAFCFYMSLVWPSSGERIYFCSGKRGIAAGNSICSFICLVSLI